MAGAFIYVHHKKDLGYKVDLDPVESSKKRLNEVPTTEELL